MKYISFVARIFLFVNKLATVTINQKEKDKNLLLKFGEISWFMKASYR